MLVMELGIVTDCKDEHQLNASLPILVTESGMLTECKDEQYKNLQLIVFQLILF